MNHHKSASQTFAVGLKAEVRYKNNLELGLVDRTE